MRALHAEDGVAAFGALYLAVTEEVGAAAQAAQFEDERFLRRLDVRFANLFFDALRRPERAPHAWRVLFAARNRADVLPLQFALAGMNAHINRDLPAALVETWAELNVRPARASPQYHDFDRVNTILSAAEQHVKARLLGGALARVDVDLGRVDDVVAMWKVEEAREAAWVNGETLWALRAAPDLRTRYLRTLDRMVGLAGRGLLRPLVRHA